MPIQQMLLGAGGAVATKTYVDDVFSTFLYRGTGNQIVINNGIDLSTEGGLVWTKNRDTSYGHFLFDTERGTTKTLSTNTNGTEGTETAGVNAFNSNGFSVGTNGTNDGAFNHTSYDYSSWTFRKAEGFFDIVEWSGTSSTKHVPHNLGVVPGAIWIKRKNANEKWVCWHKNGVGTNGSDYMVFNSQDGPSGGPAYFGNDPVMTSTTFEVNSDNAINNGDMIAYVFAGGGVSRPNNTDVRNVRFDGSSNKLFVEGSADFDFGTGDFTVEFWATVRDSYSNSPYFLDFRENGNDTGTTNRIVLYISSNTGKPTFWLNGSARIEAKVPVNLGGSTSTKDNWQHYALVRSSGTTTFYIDGIAQGTYSDSTDYDTSGTFGSLTIGNRQGSSSQYFKGGICDLRITKGQALYTENFNVPATALTTTSQGATASNVKLLCCQNTSATGSTVTPDSSYPTGSGSPDVQGPKRWAGNQIEDFVFGDSADQNLIKCGKYIGNGSESDGTEVHIGWEPQWLLVKRLGNAHWGIIDVLRGFTADGKGDVLFPNRTNSEDNGANSALPTPTGFKLHTTNNEWNGNNDEYIYIAIRRADGYVGKPPELGTGVFTTAVRSSSTAPRYISNFPVDFALYRNPSGTSDWYVTSRLTGPEVLKTNTTEAEVENSDYANFDHNNGFSNQGGTGHQTWMWKRHAGLDVVAYKGNSVSGTKIAHSLNKTPEMIWVKRRDDTKDWQVGHHGLNEGSSPWNYYLELNNTQAEASQQGIWNNTAPTSTHFTVGNWTQVNNSSGKYLAMLFASVNGISKVGYYTGDGSNESVTTGFQPRFIIIRRVDYAEDWFVFDSVRGLASSSADPYLRINTDAAQITTASFFDISSTGFTVTANFTNNNVPYIYYAHA